MDNAQTLRPWAEPIIVAASYNEEIAEIFPPHPAAVSPWEERGGRFINSAPEARRINAAVNAIWGELKQEAAIRYNLKNN